MKRISIYALLLAVSVMGAGCAKKDPKPDDEQEPARTAEQLRKGVLGKWLFNGTSFETIASVKTQARQGNHLVLGPLKSASRDAGFLIFSELTNSMLRTTNYQESEDENGNGNIGEGIRITRTTPTVIAYRAGDRR